MIHRSTFGKMGNDLLTDEDGFVPEPGDRWQDFSWPERIEHRLWELSQRDDPRVDLWWDDFVARATERLDEVRDAYEAADQAGLGRAAALLGEEGQLDPYIILDYIEWLQSIDYGLAASSADNAEGVLLELEAVVDSIEEEGIVLPELSAAVRYFLTDPERSRSYLYGPTDVGAGIGAIDQLKDLVDSIDEDVEHDFVL